MKGTKIKMREVDKKDYTFSNDEYDSIFVGVCKSQELLDEYLEQDYELLNVDCIGSEFGIETSGRRKRTFIFQLIFSIHYQFFWK